VKLQRRLLRVGECALQLGLIRRCSRRVAAGVFYLMFLPPLLVLDGWRIRKEKLLYDRNTILALALGLVVFTVPGRDC